ncbi:MAG: DEAD/DEAH box helicase [Anaerolineae bacterium]|nr:DEAD/DEAH box helicase [Anaerolineae bacterium]
MSAHRAAQAVKAQLFHTWPLFFSRHGNLTTVQRRTIPPLLAGRDALVVATTAAGKTEAVVAPLVERLWVQLTAPTATLTLLYICPTRALVRNLYDRLRDHLTDSGIALAMKTGDVAALKGTPCVLITTPESADSLLTRNPRLFIPLQAVIIDEVHLFDNTPRGDHLRCLLPRIERIRHYATPDCVNLQRVLLSATVPDPAGVAQRYLNNGVVIEVPGQRAIVADIAPLYDLDELVDRLADRAARKTLLFCNTRDEVERTAAYLRQNMQHEAQVFVHYGNLDARLRYEVETEFAAASVAVCVTTSTLELGIDIGSVEDVVLLGAPPTLTSFLQRIGRGSRRSAETSVLCLPKSSAEWARFSGLLALANTPPQSDSADAASYAFRPSILVQQIFSLIKQSPTGSVRYADVRRLAPTSVSSDAIRTILAELVFTDYLQSGRIGDWKPAARLQELIDRHEIYSNIGADVLALAAVDAYTNRTIAYTDRKPDVGTLVLFGGKTQRVVWHDGNRFGLASAEGQAPQEVLRYRTTYAAIPFAVTQAVARELLFKPGQMATLRTESGMWLFHFCGTIWGELLAALLGTHAAEYTNEFCLYLHEPLALLPAWNALAAEQAARKLAWLLAERLQMGRFHALLPRGVAVTAALAQIGWEDFGRFYTTASLITGVPLSDQLYALLR